MATHHPDGSYSAYLAAHGIVLRSVRLYLALGLAMLLGAGALIDAYGLLERDPRWIRFAFAGLVVAILASTYLSPRVAAHVRGLLLGLAVLMVGWLGVLLALNDLAPAIATVYFTMAFTGGTLFAIAFRGVRATGGFLATCLVAAGVAAAVAREPQTNPWMFLSCLVATSAVVVATARIRERLTRSLTASRRLYAEAETAGGIGSWVLDVGTGTARWSDGMCALLGVPPLGDRPAPSMEAYVDARDLPAAQAAFDAVVHGDLDAHDLTVRVTAADGRARTLGGVVRAERGADGEVARVVGVATDVTAQAAHQAELVRALDRAEAAARLKAAILANMSHEIRTPLTAVIGFAELLATEADADTAPLVQPILTGGQRLMDTLNSVLDLARLEADGDALDVWPVDLGQAARAAVDVYAETAAASGLALRVQAGGPAVALGDAAAVGRVIDNLVSNALRFTEAGGVTLRADVADGHAVLDVVDTGRGMDAAFVPRAAEAFVQASDGDARSHEGSGLGLTIVHRLVEAMGGTVGIESALGEGTRVRVSLPLAEAGAAPPPETSWVARRRLAPMRPAAASGQPA